MKEKYKKLQRKYKLPNYGLLNSQFELDYIEDGYFLLRSIRRRVHEKVVFFARLFERVLFPNQNFLIEMHETKFFTDKEKDELFKTYEDLLSLDRKALSLNISSTDNKEAEYIRSVFKKWPSFTKKSQSIIDKLDKSWKQKGPDLTSTHYFG